MHCHLFDKTVVQLYNSIIVKSYIPSVSLKNYFIILILFHNKCHFKLSLQICKQFFNFNFIDLTY